jgi:hypothetical protein
MPIAKQPEIANAKRKLWWANKKVEIAYRKLIKQLEEPSAIGELK